MQAFTSKPKVKARLAACLDLSHSLARGQFSSPRSIKSKCSNLTFHFQPEVLIVFILSVSIYLQKKNL